MQRFALYFFILDPNRKRIIFHENFLLIQDILFFYNEIFDFVIYNSCTHMEVFFNYPYVARKKILKYIYRMYMYIILYMYIEKKLGFHKIILP